MSIVYILKPLVKWKIIGMQIRKMYYTYTCNGFHRSLDIGIMNKHLPEYIVNIFLAAG